MADGIPKNGGDGGLEEWKEFIDQVAHDLASPISFLDQYVNKLSVTRGEYSSDECDIAEAAKRSFGKVRNLIDQLREFVRESEMKFAYSDFSTVVKNAVAEAMPVAFARRIDISYDGPMHLIGLFDEKKLERVLSNLIMNSVQAFEGECGEIRISLSHDRRSVWLEVKDTGKGIMGDVIGHVFDRGFTNGKKGGTGLGLAYCRRIAEAHGGSISIYSREGKGATFSIVFPLAAAIKFERAGSGKGDVVILDDDAGGWLGWLEALYESGAAGAPVVDRESYLARHEARDITFDPID